jgi:hypothetical protein
MRSFLEAICGLTYFAVLGIAILAGITWLGEHDGPSPFVDNNTCVIAHNGGTVCGPRAP